MTKPAHNIDLQKLSDIGQIGVRRAVLFAGIGLNAANRQDLKAYQLKSVPQSPEEKNLPIDFFPDNLPDERVSEFKKAFAAWIISSALREVIEHYALMLDQIYIHGLIVLHAKGELKNSSEPEKQVRRFQRCGLPAKFEHLEESFGIKIDGADQASRIYEARNAITHDLGMVTAERAPKGVLPVGWRRWDLVATGIETGQSRPLEDIVGQMTTEEMQVTATFVDRTKDFPVGSSIELTAAELSESCFFFSSALIPAAIKGFEDFLKKHHVGPPTT